MSLHQEDYRAKAQSGWAWLVEWSHGHTAFVALAIGLILGWLHFPWFF